MKSAVAILVLICNDQNNDRPSMVTQTPGSPHLSRDLHWAIPVALAARVGFWLLTSRVWEDGLITVAHARNAVEGIGLTHHPGEGNVHGFTSALSVLIPLVGEGVASGAGILALRLASLVAVVIALVYADRLLVALAVGRWPRRFALAYLALDPLHVFYGMAGMETEVATAILLASVWYSLGNEPARFGTSLGLSMLARPDFVIWVACSALGTAITQGWRWIGRAVGVAALVVLPWIAFTVLYYGSPIPQTIAAKALVFQPQIGSASSFLMNAAQHLGILARTFAPFYEDTGVISSPLPISVSFGISVVIWALAVTGMVEAWQRPRWRPVVLFVISFTAYRVIALPGYYFTWYLPPVTAVSVVLVAAGIGRAFGQQPVLRKAVPAGLGLIFALPLLLTTGLEARVQSVIENGVRQRVGEYLAAQARPGEAVALEAAGYFGYYSGMKVFDYPGLTSPTALAALRAMPREERSPESLMAALQPRWLVVRPTELHELERKYPYVASRYSLCAQFDAGLGGSIEWGGLVLHTIDDRFAILRRDGCPQEPAGTQHPKPRS